MSTERKSTCRRIGASVLGVCAGVLVAGLAPPVHAQTCDPVEAAKLLAGDGAISDIFGWSVSIDGDTALIGARFDDDNGSDSGSAYVFTLSGGVWAQQAKLLPADGAADDRFGFSVSLSADTALIGAPRDDDNGSGSGSAYVFTRSAGVWTQQAKLLPSDGVASDQFGWSVSIDGDTALVGAPNDDYNGLPEAGSAYVFDLADNDCPADLAEPFGSLDFSDITAFLIAFDANDCSADFAEPFGVFDFSDVVAFLVAFDAGCP